MAQFKKGEVANPRGKLKGTLNITTRQAREILNKILFAELDNIQESLKNIRIKDDSKYIECMAKLLAFSLPRKTDITSDDEPINAGFLGMTKEEIEKELAQWRNR